MWKHPGSAKEHVQPIFLTLEQRRCVPSTGAGNRPRLVLPKTVKPHLYGKEKIKRLTAFNFLIAPYCRCFFPIFMFCILTHLAKIHTASRLGG